MDHLIYQIIKNKPKTAVRALLALADISQREFAKRRGFSPSEVSKVIRGRRKNRKVQKAIAEELGVDIDLLFGDFDEFKGIYE